MLRYVSHALTVSRTSAYSVVRARGELDIAAVRDLRAAVRAAGARGGRIAVDLRDVTFMDTFALHALVALQREHAGRVSLHVVPGEGIQRVLDLAGAREALHWISPEQLGR
jgi:stage II sporulation protein AA (anti-sigma F factor antagonist)